jgi:hypothetical protein
MAAAVAAAAAAAAATTIPYICERSEKENVRVSQHQHSRVAFC